MFQTTNQMTFESHLYSDGDLLSPGTCFGAHGAPGEPVPAKETVRAPFKHGQWMNMARFDDSTTIDL